jgi:hypothetical protein
MSTQTATIQSNANVAYGRRNLSTATKAATKVFSTGRFSVSKAGNRNPGHYWVFSDSHISDSPQLGGRGTLAQSVYSFGTLMSV